MSSGWEDGFLRVGLRWAGWSILATACALAGVAVVVQAWSAALAAVVVAAIGLLTARGSAVLQDSERQRRELPQLVRLTRSGSLPRVRDLSDPLAWRVHPSADWLTGRVTPFVDRDVGPEVVKRLLSDRFVLIVGESTAGKSRLASETIRRRYGRYRLVEPVARDGVPVAVRLAVGVGRCVLWLDDVERFLGESGLARHHLDAIRNAQGERYVVATIRAEEYARLATPVGDRRPVSTEAGRGGWHVLEAMARVDLPRRWSPAELARAAEYRHDPRIASALPHADEFGLAEWLAAGPQLLTAWRDGWAPGQHPRAAAIVAAAIDARRVGVHRPLPKELLERMHRPYLEQRGGMRLRPEPFDEAMEWVLTPLYATSSLLIPGADGYLAFDYLVDASGQQTVPADTLTSLLADADPDEAAQIGWFAWISFHPEVAEQAYQHADRDREGSLAAIDFMIERGEGRAALALAEQVAAQRQAALTPDHEDLWDARLALAYVTGRVESPVRAYGMFQQLITEATEALGEGHQLVLWARLHRAEFARAAGYSATSVMELDELHADCVRLLGERHHATLTIRGQRAVAYQLSGDPKTAARMCRDLLEDLPASRADADLGLHIRWLLASCLADLGRHRESLVERDRLIEDDTARYGWRSAFVLNMRADRAEAVGKAGRPEEAVRLLREIIADWEEQSDAHPDRNLLLHKRSLAAWEGAAGRPEQAVAQLRELAALMQQSFGQDSPEVFGCLQRLAHWTVKAGRSDEALRLREDLLKHPWVTRNPVDAAVLGLRAEFAESVGEAGDPARAVDLLRAVIADRIPVSRAPDLDLLCWRRDLAVWEGKAGAPDATARQLRELAALSAKERGPEDRQTIGLVWRTADWTAKAGHIEQGIAELKTALASARRALGTDDETTRSITESLQHWNGQIT